MIKQLPVPGKELRVSSAKPCLSTDWTTTDSSQPKWYPLTTEAFNFKRTSTGVGCVTLNFHIFANGKKCFISIEITGPTIFL